MNFSSYFFSEEIALMSYNAQPVTETQNPEIYRRVAPIVRNLCQRMGLPMPQVVGDSGGFAQRVRYGAESAARLRGVHCGDLAGDGRSARLKA